MKTRFDFGRFRCAIFDLDGTLLNSTDVWAKVDIDFLGKRNIEVPEDFIRKIKTHNFATGSKYVIERFNLDEKPEDIAKEWFDMAVQAYADDIDLKPGAADFLENLRQKGYKICIATASDRELYEACLKRNKIFDYFDNFTQLGGDADRQRRGGVELRDQEYPAGVYRRRGQAPSADGRDADGHPQRQGLPHRPAHGGQIPRDAGYSRRPAPQTDIAKF